MCEREREREQEGEVRGRELGTNRSLLSVEWQHLIYVGGGKKGWGEVLAKSLLWWQNAGQRKFMFNNKEINSKK
jgi:hypothetical protein